ncbi:hypothetical protein [Neobacillus drentensis]|uniref:hypothetical protein n=1 Tax=Neobacillus drentensis TaxID=220684 RepID=UPI002FFD964F
MWIITVHSMDDVKMFEFNTQEEAKASYERIQGSKFLTEVIYFNDFSIAKNSQLPIVK